jgi:PAS domain S-box-containing protein
MTSKMHGFSRYRKYRLFSLATAGFSVAVGMMVIIGWLLRASVLTSIVPGLVTMKPNTAMCFVLAGIALWFLCSPAKQLSWFGRFKSITAKVCAAIIFIIGLATLPERLFGWTLDIDELLFRQRLLATQVPRPGLMAASTALAFIFLGMALLLLDWETRHKCRPAQILALPVVLIGIISLLGYLYGVQLLFGAAGYSVVAVNTGVAFIFIGTGVLAARPGRGLMAVLTSERLGGLLGRRLLPVVVCLPVLVGWLRLRGHHAQLYTVEFGTALSASSYIIILASLVWFCALWLNRIDSARRRAEERDLELAAIVGSSTDAILGKTLDGTITSWNKGAEQMYGYREEEVLGKNVALLAPPDRTEEILRILAELRKGAPIKRFETQRQRKDGKIIHVSLAISPIYNRDGELVGASTVARDITEQQQVAERLSQSEAQIKAIIDSAMDAVITVDSQQEIVMFNPAAEKMFRCSAAEALGSPLDRFIPERFRAAHSQHVRQFGATGITSRVMGTLGALKGVRTGGEEFPIEASISQTVSSGKKLYTAIVRDITARKGAEEALQLAQSRLVSALEGGRMGTWVWDTGTNQVIWDDAMSRLFGRTASDLGGGSIEPFFSWIHSQDRERTRAALENAVREGSSYDAEYRLFRPDQSMVWIAARGRVERDGQGRAFRMTGICIDITDRKKMEEQLLQSQKMESLGTLAGGIAHDFNNILLAIGGNAHFAMEELPPDHLAQTSLREIAKAGARATNLVRQILSFSRRQNPDRKPVKVQPVMEEALALLRATLPARIEIRSSFSPALPSISADSTQLHQVIMNLATNAVRAMGEQPGILEVIVKPVTIASDFSVPNIKLKAGEYVRVSISDTGCGMEASVLERIFDPFFTTQAPGQGTGLGLSVVHGIAKDHDAAISVYSEPGKGTVFHLYFPAIGKGADTAKPLLAAPRGRGQHLLYVDDEEALVMLATRSLGRLGYKVTGEIDPVRASQLFRKNPAQFDAVVTDLSMPGMSGSELARQIMEVRPDIPVVMMSGYLRPEDEEEARRLGVRDLILKPDTIEDLAQSLDRLFTTLVR